MGRAGGGGGGRSSSSRSSSRSSSSHRSSSSSSRAGRGSSYSSSRSSGSRYYGGGRSNHHHHYHHGGGYHHHHYSSGNTSGFGCATTIVAAIFLLIAAAYIFMWVRTGSENSVSTIERHRVESGLAYDNNVVLMDELGWIESTTTVGRELRYFYDETGVQPYIILLDYKEELRTDAQKEAYTVALYDELIDREDALLFVYYGEYYEDDVGLMTLANGKLASSVFDSEAIDIYYNKLDYYWYGDYSTTDVFVNAYEATADTIMGAPTNMWDTVIVIIIAGVVVTIPMIILAIIRNKRKAEKEKAIETERLLRASMDSVAEEKSKGETDLLDKYL